MKYITAITLGSLLTLNSAFAGEPAPADQKWLAAVEKMVAEGQTRVSTPRKERVDLLQEWADKKGYSVEVNKSDTNYRVKLSKGLAKS